jgi:hypothetical protein
MNPPLVMQRRWRDYAMTIPLKQYRSLLWYVAKILRYHLRRLGWVAVKEENMGCYVRCATLAMIVKMAGF